MNNRRLVIRSFLALILTSFIGLGTTFAWFGKINQVYTDNMKGSVLSSYFHCGSGNENDPFVITRPKHWENLIKLHNNVPEFYGAEAYKYSSDTEVDPSKIYYTSSYDEGTKKYTYTEVTNPSGNPLEQGYFEKARGYHFQVGYDLDGSGEMKVYEYEGRLHTGDYSTILNLESLNSLIPLGQPDNPFYGSIEGNNISIENFEVKGDGCTDIGIFGFVGESGRASDLYFSHYTIDTSNNVIDNSELEDATTSHIAHARRNHINTSTFGYLAGHIVYAGNFTNVYCNDCKMKGGNNNNNNLSNNSYYGLVDYDSIGGSTGKGSDYKFTLNSDACYSYFENNYDTIANDQLVLRETAQTEVNPDEVDEYGRQLKDITNKTGSAPIPMSTAVEKTTVTGAVNGTPVFKLNGNNPTSTSGNINYSLSTTGSKTPEYISVEHDFEAKYLLEGNYITPDEEPSYSATSLKGDGKGLNYDEETGEWYPTKYYYQNKNDGNRWYYGESYDRNVDRNRDIYTFDCAITIASQSFSWLAKPTIQKLEGRIYFDEDVDGEPLVLSSQVTGGGLFRNYVVNFTCQDFVKENVLCGLHHYSIYIEIEYSNWASGENNRYLYDGTYVQNTNTLNQKDIDFHSNITQSIAMGNSYRNEAIENFQHTTFVFDPEYVFEDQRTFEVPIYYFENGSLTEETGTDFVAGDFSYDAGKSRWGVYKVRREPIPGGDAKRYIIGDDPILTNSGYNSRNIDIVGGDTTFYCRSILTYSIRIISLPTENRDGLLVKKPTASDIGKKYYSTTYNPDCVVLYLRNTSNALDDRDDKLGHIEFTYVQINLGGLQIRLVDPTFKKGDAHLSLETAGVNVETSNPNFLTRKVSLDLLESTVQQVSYCALDEEGKILGTFGTNGSTLMSDADKAKIYTYVIAIGGNANNNTFGCWITNVDFNYKAIDGYGGNLGSVGYRFQGDPLITETILNFYVKYKESESAEYYFRVYYVNSTNTYYVDAYSSIDITMNTFLYDNNFILMIRTKTTDSYTQLTGRDNTVDILASDPSSWVTDPPLPV